MSLEIRPIRPGEMDALKAIIQNVFAADSQMHVDMKPEWTLCAFEDGTMTTSSGAWPLTMLLNGAAAPISGVTMVGTLIGGLLDSANPRLKSLDWLAAWFYIPAALAWVVTVIIVALNTYLLFLTFSEWFGS